jgi:diaminopimelate decarboxylase
MTDWSRLSKCAAAVVGTPCFLVSEQAVRAQLTTLQAIESSVPLRHWLSLKTQPLARLVDAALEWGIGIEVVSEFELEAVLGAGTAPDRILVNGVGKPSWLPQHRVANMSVHFDSLSEVRELASFAKTLDWQVGLRCAIPPRPSAVQAAEWDQFGMTADELRGAAAFLADAGVPVRGLHFHLHTNVDRVSDYQHALAHVADVAAALNMRPDYFDIGGGLPIAGERVYGKRATRLFDLKGFRDLLGSIRSRCPGIREVWLENGRFLTGPAGALVVSVLDKKDRGGRRYLICDGGRTNHARPAATELHDILLETSRGGPLRPTVLCGPTCGAVDRLGEWMLPESVVPGDRIIWLNAGAYHIPLETRFSFGLAPVVWFDEADEPHVVRSRETAAEWWNQWISPVRIGHVLSA